MNPHYLPFFSALLGAGILSAVTTMPQAAVTRDGETYYVKTPEKTIAVTPLSADIFQVTSIPAGEQPPAAGASKIVILDPDRDAAHGILTNDEFSLVSPTTTVKVDRRTGKTIFLNQAGDTLLAESGGLDNSGKIKRASFATDAGQNFYGAGERGHSLRLNGDTLVMFNRQNYGYTGGDPRISQMGITMPWIASDEGYGILFDDYNMATLTLGDTTVYESETPKALSYYFVNGNGSLAGTVSNYTSLTGRQDLPPFWSLGYITSKYGYHNEKEALGAIDSLKNLGYPVDGIVFDLYWYGKETDMGRLEWNTVQFPDHRKMLDSLSSMGVHTVLISQPYINKQGAIDNYNTLSAGGMLVKDSDGNTHDVNTWVGEAGMFDISNPTTREWLWNRLRPLTADGLSGWWGDLGEPEVHPLSIVHSNGETASQYHNIYGNEWSRLIYEGLRKDFPEMRPLLLMRGGTAGLQRYSVFPWTTDVSRSWGGLEPQVNLMLNSGLSGLGYMSSDVGGFAVDPAKPYNPELYVRWLEAGTFSPVLRTHAQYKPEPYHYGQHNDIILKFIKMRYQWLPYNYTLAWENASEGLPLARPLNFRDNGGGDRYADVQDEYLWGDEVLVAPVLKAGARSRKVLFPAGEWISWNNPSARYSGGSTATVAAPLGELPLFVKAGSFIPQYMKPVGNTGDYDPSSLTVRYFPSADESEYTLFEDDRKDPESIKRGLFRLTTFKGRSDRKRTEINVSSKGSYPGMPQEQTLTFVITGVPRPVSVNTPDWKYDATGRTLTIPVKYTGEEITLEITNR